MSAISRRSAAVAVFAVVLGLVVLAAAPRAAEANIDCSMVHTIRVDFIDDATLDLLTAPGSSVLVTPDPVDGFGNRTYIDNGLLDENPAIGRIEQSGACQVNLNPSPGPIAYTVQVTGVAANCHLVTAPTQALTLITNGIVTYHVNGCTRNSSNVAIVDVAPAANQVDCGASTGVSIAVRTGTVPAPNGTEVKIATSAGDVEPRTAYTSLGVVNVIYRSPANFGGTAVIEAKSLAATGTGVLTVNCAAPSPPPPPAAPQQEVLSATAGGLPDFPTATCIPTTSVVVRWEPVAGLISQWFDISFADDGFAGPYTGNPLNPASDHMTLNDIAPSRSYFWRVNSQTSLGWVTAASGAFVPCGSPRVRGDSHACDPQGTADVTLFWVPTTPAAISSWVDVSLADNNFAPGTFVSYGPIAGSQGRLVWNDLLANQRHYWRVNSQFPGGWLPSATGTFEARC